MTYVFDELARLVNIIMECSEIEIPAPWGHIAAKLWGDVANEAIIVTHGQTDNAGSFDTLIPLLPTSFYYICLDLPGHGKSSHFPHLQSLHPSNLLLAIRLATEHFRREKYVFLGHSVGGSLNLLFAQLYPELVSKLIVLDSFYLYPSRPKEFLNWIEETHSLISRMLEEAKVGSEPPRYTWNEVVDKVMKGRWVGELTWETAEQIARRMVEKVGENAYVITLDRRMKIMHGISASWDYLERMLKSRPVKCPALFVVTSSYRYLSQLRKEQKKYPNFHVRVFKGHHHSHHTNPEAVAPYVREFLLQQNSKL